MGLNVGTSIALVGLNVGTSVFLGVNVGTSSVLVEANDGAVVSAKQGINIMKSRGAWK